MENPMVWCVMKPFWMPESIASIISSRRALMRLADASKSKGIEMLMESSLVVCNWSAHSARALSVPAVCDQSCTGPMVMFGSSDGANEHVDAKGICDMFCDKYFGVGVASFEFLRHAFGHKDEPPVIGVGVVRRAIVVLSMLQN